MSYFLTCLYMFNLFVFDIVRYFCLHFYSDSVFLCVCFLLSHQNPTATTSRHAFLTDYEHIFLFFQPLGYSKIPSIIRFKEIFQSSSYSNPHFYCKLEGTNIQSYCLSYQAIIFYEVTTNSLQPNYLY